MEDVLHIILGAAVALFGSVVTARFQQKLESERKDVEKLLAINRLLLEYSAKYGELEAEHPTLTAKGDSSRLQEDLSDLALQVRTKKYRELAVRVTKFALDPLFRKKGLFQNLLRDVQIAINAEMIEQYEEEMDDLGKQVGNILERKG